MADLSTVNADGYFKEDLKVEVGSFNFDMLDLDSNDEKPVLDYDELVDVKKNKPTDEDEEA